MHEVSHSPSDLCLSCLISVVIFSFLESLPELFPTNGLTNGPTNRRTHPSIDKSPGSRLIMNKDSWRSTPLEMRALSHPHLLSFRLYLFSYKNLLYKNVETQICLKFQNNIVILLVAISISFPDSNEI